MTALEQYPPGKYLIRRHGGWFRPNAQGYCTDICDAGIYDRDDAIRYLDVEGLTIHPARTLLAEAEATMQRLFLQAVRLETVIQQLKESA
jgi:hypothetical protein